MNCCKWVAVPYCPVSLCCHALGCGLRQLKAFYNIRPTDRSWCQLPEQALGCVNERLNRRCRGWRRQERKNWVGSERIQMFLGNEGALKETRGAARKLSTRLEPPDASLRVADPAVTFGATTAHTTVQCTKTATIVVFGAFEVYAPHEKSLP